MFSSKMTTMPQVSNNHQRNVLVNTFEVDIVKENIQFTSPDSITPKLDLKKEEIVKFNERMCKTSCSSITCVPCISQKKQIINKNTSHSRTVSNIEEGKLGDIIHDRGHIKFENGDD